jgi:hypothetical protein
MAIRTLARHGAAALLVAIAASGCAAGNRANNPSWPGSGTPATNQVRVVNRSWASIEVYVVYADRGFHLGTVEGSRTATLTIPESFSDSAIRLSARPVGGGESYTTPVLIWTNRGFSLTVESDISRSSYGIG